jgi:hypothetical protein
MNKKIRRSGFFEVAVIAAGSSFPRRRESMTVSLFHPQKYPKATASFGRY